MKLSIAILTWNCINTLRETLDILKEDLKDIKHEIIIVDNGSNDGCEELATYANGRNLGISIGKNQGIEASSGEYVLLLDGDIVPVPNSINCLLEWLEDNPDKDAIGFFPNKYSREHNTETNKSHHEVYCNELHNPELHPGPCIYFGMFRRTVFDKGLRCSEEPPFGEEGYGWEDFDFYELMIKLGMKQYCAGINNAAGKYYHDINSSIKVMGHKRYMETSKERGKHFKAKWGATVNAR